LSAALGFIFGARTQVRAYAPYHGNRDDRRQFDGSIPHSFLDELTSIRYLI
jgi:hypothetical protein